MLRSNRNPTKLWACLAATVLACCGGSPAPAPAASPAPPELAPPAPATAPELATPAPVAQPEPPPAAPTQPCEIVEAIATRRSRTAFEAIETRAVTPAPGAWTAGTSPPLLTRTEALARGGREGDDASVSVDVEGAPAPVAYTFDREGRPLQAHIRSQPRYQYLFHYDCRGLAVVYPDRSPAPCRVFDEGGVKFVCVFDDPRPCETEVAQGELADRPGDETVLACRGNCEAPDALVHVVLGADRTPIWAVHATQDIACQTARITRGALRVEGGGEDGRYDATFAWRGGQMTLQRSRYRVSPHLH